MRTSAKNWWMDGRVWIYARLGHDTTSWRLAGERLATGSIAWVHGAEAIRRLYELGLSPGAHTVTTRERRGLSVIFATVERGEWRIIGWQRVSRLDTSAH